ncbi:MAG: hypothetical protein M1821_002446 [Bathelium mastoideum]|nr:MAG: hypothetical protein M1821_002446 [Bathelium mastoideum]
MASQQGLYYVQEVPLGMRIAQVVGITSATFLSGSSATYSFATIPTILGVPASHRAKAWKSTYETGMRNALTLAAGSTLAFTYLAVKSYPVTVPFYLYTAAAVLSPSIVPYTRLVMIPINRVLMAKADSSSASPAASDAVEKGIGSEGETDELLKKWARLSYGRVVLQGAAALLALWAVASRPEVVAFTKIEAAL